MTYPEYIILIGFISAVTVIIGMPVGALLGGVKTKEEREAEDYERAQYVHLWMRDQKALRSRRRARA